jgi:hypothetical protein
MSWFQVRDKKGAMKANHATFKSLSLGPLRASYNNDRPGVLSGKFDKRHSIEKIPLKEKDNQALKSPKIIPLAPLLRQVAVVFDHSIFSAISKGEHVEFQVLLKTISF